MDLCEDFEYCEVCGVCISRPQKVALAKFHEVSIRTRSSAALILELELSGSLCFEQEFFQVRREPVPKEREQLGCSVVLGHLTNLWQLDVRARPPQAAVQVTVCHVLCKRLDLLGMPF